MKKIVISDMTLAMQSANLTLSFKEKLEIAKLLDKMKVDYIELPELTEQKVDALLMRTIATTVKYCGVSMPAGYSQDSVERAWTCIQKAAKPRLHVIIPCSTVQMEYMLHMKPAVALDTVKVIVEKCRSYCADIDFTAEDATRAEPAFLEKAISTAIAAGATTVTLSDSAGLFMPDEYAAFIEDLTGRIPALKNVNLAVKCMNEIDMSAANALTAIHHGASEIKTVVSGTSYPNVSSLAHILKVKHDALNACCGISTMEMQRITKQIEWITRNERGSSPFEKGVETGSSTNFTLSGYDTADDVAKAALRLGYELTPEDTQKVFDAFKGIADKKEVSARELEAIIASVALQVPPTYTLVNYVINAGNNFTATSNIVLAKNGTNLRGLSAGDGSIDASFLAIEQIVGTHYELDDFQIQAVTQGREAMGSAVVKLRSNGRLYSGSGISTDIIGASIHAYINAVNKIVYEEA